MGEEDDVALAIKNAEEGMSEESEKGLFKQVKGHLGNLQSKGRQGVVFVNGIKNITKAVAYSQEALKICRAIDDKNRKPEDLRVAAKVVQRGINLTAEVMRDFPTTMQGVLPVQQKLQAQLEQIREIGRKEFGIEVN